MSPPNTNQCHSKTPIAQEFAATWRLAWPIMGAQLLSFSMSTVDTMFVGRLGSANLAALAIGTNLTAIVHLIAIGCLAIVGPLTAEAWADNQETKWVRLRQIVSSDLRICLSFAFIGFWFLFFPQKTLELLGQNPLLIETVTPYLRCLAVGLPGYCLYLGLRQINEGSGQSMPTIIAALMATVLNFILNYIFVFGYGSIPALGLLGAGIATAIVQWLMALGLWLNLYGNKRYVHLKSALLPRFLTPLHLREASVTPMIKRILRLGIPSSLANIAEMGFFVACTMLSGSISIIAQAVHQVAINAAAMLFMIPLGMSFAVTVRIGEAAGNVSLIRRRAYVGLALTTGLALMNACIFYFFRDQILNLYTTDPHVIQAGQTLLLIAAFFQLADGLQVVGIGILRGIKDTTVPFLAALISFWGIGFPTALWLTFDQDFGVSGLWWGMLIGLSLAAACHHIRFRIKISAGNLQ